MLTGPAQTLPGWCRRTLAGLLALVMAGAIAVRPAGPARADAVRNQQMWVLNAINATSAWTRTRGQGVTVAVIDSGVNPGVSDLTGSVATGPDLSGVSTAPSNRFWGVHGTWMASLIAGHGHAGGSNGILGVAPQARILSIRVVTDQGDPGFGRYERERASRVQRALASAIHYAAAKHRADVISMSLGYGAASLPVRTAIQYALAKGVVVVASSGNSGGSSSAKRQQHAPYSFPANYPGVLGVGAVAQGGKPAPFSSNNLSVQVAAPGVKVPAQGRDGHYWLVSGTSPACALTAGVAALIKSRYPKLPPAEVVQAITASVRNRPRGGYDERVGFGTVDAEAALALAGRLSHDSAAGGGLRASEHFGGGPAAVPPVPVPPRGRQQLVLYGLLALACLALMVRSVVRLAAFRRRRPAGTGGPPAPWQGGAVLTHPGQAWPPRPEQAWPPQPGQAGAPGQAGHPGHAGSPGQAWPPPPGQTRPPQPGRTAPREQAWQPQPGQGWPSQPGQAAPPSRAWSSRPGPGPTPPPGGALHPGASPGGAPQGDGPPWGDPRGGVARGEVPPKPARWLPEESSDGSGAAGPWPGPR